MNETHFLDGCFQPPDKMLIDLYHAHTKLSEANDSEQGFVILTHVGGLLVPLLVMWVSLTSPDSAVSWAALEGLIMPPSHVSPSWQSQSPPRVSGRPMASFHGAQGSRTTDSNLLWTYPKRSQGHSSGILLITTNHKVSWIQGEVGGGHCWGHVCRHTLIYLHVSAHVVFTAIVPNKGLHIIFLCFL